MTANQRPAAHWRIGDLLLPRDGSPRVITLHRIEGAPGVAVVEFADISGQTRYQLSHTETISRSA